MAPDKARHAGKDREEQHPNADERLSYNARLILTLLRLHGPSAKARIADLTGLSAQSASVIMRKLETEGYIERRAPLRGKVGQPQVPMALRPQGALFLGLKIGRRSANLILVDFLGTILDKVSLTYPYPDPDVALDFVQNGLATITARLKPAQRARLAGLGISIPGFLWQWAEAIGEPPEKTAAWRGRDLRREVAALVPYPVYLRNDVSCACDAELVFGEAERPTDFLYIYVGHFIGGGVVLNNRTYTGPTGNAGALGPLPIPMPGHGMRQLVDVSSLHLLEKAIVDGGEDAAVLWADTANWDIPEDILTDWLDTAAHGLAHAIAMSCAVIDFELVVIDGFLPADVRRRLIDRTAAALPACDWTGLTRPDLRAGAIGADARSLGAAGLPLSKRFLVAPVSD